MRLIFRLAVLSAFGMFGVGQTNAAYTVTFNQVGNNVVVTGSGSLNLTGVSLYPYPGGGFVKPSIQANVGLVSFGVPDGVPYNSAYDEYSINGYGIFSYGGRLATNYFNADSRTGDAVQLIGTFLYVPSGYKSNTSLSSMMTFLNMNYADLGLVVGTYSSMYAGTIGGKPVDTITIQINPASVPEPSTLILLSFGMAGTGLVVRKL